MDNEYFELDDDDHRQQVDVKIKKRIDRNKSRELRSDEIRKAMRNFRKLRGE